MLLLLPLRFPNGSQYSCLHEQNAKSIICIAQVLFALQRHAYPYTRTAPQAPHSRTSLASISISRACAPGPGRTPSWETAPRVIALAAPIAAYSSPPVGDFASPGRIAGTRAVTNRMIVLSAGKCCLAYNTRTLRSKS